MLELEHLRKMGNLAILGNMFGRTDELFSQTTVSRFEAMNLTYSNMAKILPFFKKWLQEADPRTASGILSIQEYGNRPGRKKRTTIDSHMLQTLEAYFQRNQKPTSEELLELSQQLQVNPAIIFTQVQTYFYFLNINKSKS